MEYAQTRPDDGAAESRETARREPVITLALTLEVLLYVALIALSVTLRTVQLGSVPLSEAEAHDALAALRQADPGVPGEPLVANSPITFALHTLDFNLFVPGDAVARFPGVLAGVLLALAPVLWRRYLNPLPPLIMSLLLVLSPTVLLASRTTSPALWTMLLALAAPYVVLRFVETGHRGYAIAATAAVGAMIFLTEAAGFLAVLALGLGVVFALLTEDDPDAAAPRELRALLRRWPWSGGLLAAGALIVLVPTVFFLIPDGLSAVGKVVTGAWEGFVERPADVPVAFPMWVALRYEFGLVLFGLIAVVHAIRFGGFFERAVAGWFLAGLMFAVGYAGAGAAHALWIVLPLVVLVSLMVVRWLVERPTVVWIVPAWGMPLHALLTLVLWLAVGMSVVLLGKLLMVDLPDGVTNLRMLAESLVSGVYNRDTASAEVALVGETQVLSYVLGYLQLRLLLIMLVTLLIGVLFFLMGSLWGARTGWRGLALGTLSALLLLSFGVGGRAALEHATDARELWFPHPVTDDVHELRDVLRTMSLRENGTPYQIAITAQVPEDGILAWALRDYPYTTFVRALGPQVHTPVVLASAEGPRPQLGADYIGRLLEPYSAWDTSLLSWRDVILWYYRGASEVGAAPVDPLRIWVRGDVYGVERVPEE